MNRAFAELNAASDEEDLRQAAEKGWRAAREAVYAVMQAAGIRPRGTLGAGAVAAFEYKILKRPRQEGQPLADGYASAISTLHGDCFYDGRCPDPDDLHVNLERVTALVEQAEFDLRRMRRRK